MGLGLEPSEAIIPSDPSIKVARERRELLRKAGVSSEDDFISLSVIRRSEDQGPHPESRLMREEDEVGDADDGLFEFAFFCLAFQITHM